MFSHCEQKWRWPCREEGETGWCGRVGKRARREKTVCRLFILISNPPSAQQQSTWLVNMCPMTDSWQKGNYSIISFVQSITKTSDASHAMVRIIPIIKIFVLEKLKLLKITSLKAEEKQAVVSVLNTDAWLLGSAVGVVADFGLSPVFEDFDLRFQLQRCWVSQSSEVASTSATTSFKLLAFKKWASSMAFQIFNAHFTDTLEE